MTAVKPIIYTHNGEFHADEVFGIAVLRNAFPRKEFDIVRTRDKEVLDKAISTSNTVFQDRVFVLDVGGVYDADKNVFDHHQKGGVIDKGRSFATAGLVWKKYGSTCVKNFVREMGGNYLSLLDDRLEEIADAVDRIVVSDIDAVDVGERLLERGEFSFSQFISGFNPPVPPLGLEIDNEAELNDGFMSAIEQAERLIKREIRTQTYNALNAQELNRYIETGDEIVVMDRMIPFDDVIIEEDTPDIKRVVYPSQTGEWMVLKTRWSSDLPESWAGLRDEDLAKVTGIDDSIFCHNGRFIAGFKSKDSAINAAEMSLGLQQDENLGLTN